MQLKITDFLLTLCFLQCLVMDLREGIQDTMLLHSAIRSAANKARDRLLKRS